MEEKGEPWLNEEGGEREEVGGRMVMDFLISCLRNSEEILRRYDGFKALFFSLGMTDNSFEIFFVFLF